MAGYNEKKLLKELADVKSAQAIYANFTQEQVNKIFKAAALAVNKERISLAKMAVEETGMGYVEDKVIKNHFASEFIYNKYKNEKTAGIIEEDFSSGIVKIAEPVGVIAAIIPTTNPTSTAIFKVLMALKTRNGIFLAPHPRARKCTIKSAQIIIEAAEQAGAPKGLLGFIDEVEKGVNPVVLTSTLMANADLILATGGPGMVKAAYSSGTPAIGVGAGNTAVIVDKSADLEMTASNIIHSKSFDYGIICASEQSVIADSAIYEDLKTEFVLRGAYILNSQELKKVQTVILKDGSLNNALVGQSPQVIAEIAGIKVPAHTRIIIGEVSDYSLNEPFAHEKLSILLALYKYDKFSDGLKIASQLIDDSGIGHTSVIYADEITAADEIKEFYSKINTCRVLVNSPASQGGLGDIYNFALDPSLTLGCGTRGGNAVSENVSPKHLINIKTVAKRRENMLWMRVPEKIYFKFGCLKEALNDLVEDGYKKVFIVTDKVLHEIGFTSKVTDILNNANINFTIFSDVDPDPTIDNVEAGAKQMARYQPDCIIALGGGSAMDAAKIMWLLYEQPDTKFEDLAVTFMDIRKRIKKFPKLGKKAYFVAITTTSGTGSEVTPFSVITDRDGTKYPLADYEITPKMAINDASLTMSMPASLCAASGIDVFTHAVESYVSIVATEFTEPYSLTSAKLVFESLADSYKSGDKNVKAKEKMAIASTMAGMAFANAYLGICHSMAHKIGARFHIPHGVANAMLLAEVIRYNATDKPYRQGTFAQYTHPQSLTKYAKMARELGLNGNSNEDLVEKLIDHFNALKREIDIPMSIKAWGVDEKQFLDAIDELSERAFNDQCTGANPRYPKISDLKEIYLRSFYGTEYTGDRTYEIGK